MGLPLNNGLQALNLLNPLAPPVYGGLNTPEGFADFTYPVDVSLTANQTLNYAEATNTDADFQLMGLIINNYTSIAFSLLINVNGVYFMSSSPILAGNLASDPSAPPPVLGKFIIPRGAIVNIQFIELSGAPNAIEILLKGVKMYGHNPQYDTCALPTQRSR